jgi:glycosyltransferase involved in cell wall biosynthesis
MLVGNDIRNDARVKKSAVSLVRLGCRVTLVGRSASGVREEAEMSGVQVVRVPVPWVHRKAGAVDAASASHWWRSEDARRAATRALAARDRGHEESIGRAVRRFGAAGGALARAWWAVAHVGNLAARRVVRVHRGLARRVERRRGGLLHRGWRWYAGAALDYREHMTDEVVALAPDAIHAHDVNMMAVADAAVSVLAARGRRVEWVYDAHELVSGLSVYAGRSVLERAAWAAIEARYIRRAARVVTVSPALAAELQRAYRLPRLPEVVVNAPWERPLPEPVVGVREELGLAADVPLAVYSGGLTEARGVATVVEALPRVPGVHVVVIPTPARAPHVQVLAERATELGVADRFHVAAPVPPDRVVENLSTADVGLIPIMRFPSHDVALTNKLFEYLHAGLPVVVSDCPSQAAFVREHGIGTVHVAGDPESAAQALRDAFSRTAALREAVRGSSLRTQWSWQQSERTLGALYADLLGPVEGTPAAADFPTLDEAVSPPREPLRVVVRGRTQPEVPTALERAALGPVAEDEPATVALVPVDDPDGGRNGDWERQVAASVDDGQSPVLLVTGERLARTWQADEPDARATLADLAAVRAFPGPVVTTVEEVADRVPGTILAVDGVGLDEAFRRAAAALRGAEGPAA